MELFVIGFLVWDLAVSAFMAWGGYNFFVVFGTQLLAAAFCVFVGIIFHLLSK